MLFFNPDWGGLEYVQDTPPPDSMSIAFLPSVANDSAAAQLQMDAQESTRSFMQSQFRAATENMYESGLVLSVQG